MSPHCCSHQTGLCCKTTL